MEGKKTRSQLKAQRNPSAPAPISAVTATMSTPKSLHKTVTLLSAPTTTGLSGVVVPRALNMALCTRSLSRCSCSRFSRIRVARTLAAFSMAWTSLGASTCFVFTQPSRPEGRTRAGRGVLQPGARFVMRGVRSSFLSSLSLSSSLSFPSSSSLLSSSASPSSLSWLSSSCS